MKAVKKQNLSRRDKARATRSKVIRSAYESFCEAGFRATTMEGIAERAGVAVQTVYFIFRTKDALLQAVHDWTVLDDDPVPPPMQPWHVAAMSQPDAHGALAGLVSGIAAIDARIAPLIPTLHAVTGELAGEVHERSEARRRTDMARLVRELVTKTPLASGMTRLRAADLLFVLTGPECYRSFVLTVGWSQRAWIDWVTTSLTRDLFGEPAQAGRRSP